MTSAAPATAPAPATDAYRRDGFAIFPSAVPGDLIATARAAAHDIAAGRYATGREPILARWRADRPQPLVKIDDAHVSDERLRAVAMHPAVAANVRAATGARRIQLWASQLLIKPPGSGSDGHVGWHQDFHYWRYWQDPAALMTAWIALADVGEDSGPMRFVVGSHHWGYRGLGEGFEDERTSEAAARPPDGGPAAMRAVVVPAGGMSVHDSLLVHGSGDNASREPRVALALHLRSERSRARDGATEWYVKKERLDDEWRCPWIA